MKRKLGGILVEQGLISEKDLENAVREQQRVGGRLGAVLCELGLLTEAQIAQAVADQAGVGQTGLDELTIDPEVVTLVPENFAREHFVVPLRFEGEELVVAMVNPTDIVVIDALQKLTDRFVKVLGAAETPILRALNRLYRGHSSEELDDEIRLAVQQGEDGEEGATALVDRLVDMGIRMDATDLHIEPEEKSLRVRFRVDGELVRGPNLPFELAQPIATRIKILADMNIAESRLPQDGKFRFAKYGRQLDLRVSTFPSVRGESIVLRLLDRSRGLLSLTELGLDEERAQALRRLSERPNGLILVTGPTGSGKTTTLYSMLRGIDSTKRKIITLEDPVEYALASTTQCQINERAGITFAAGLRAILRHDPDVILVGEMRDKETAAVSMRAALTGHLVLSTLHTNDAFRTLARLRDLDVEAFLVGNCLLAIVAQRLVRMLCGECRQPCEPTPEELIAAGVDEDSGPWWTSRGCLSCNDRGVFGRSALFEILPITPGLSAGILAGQSEEELRELALEGGFVSFRQAALERAREGEISLQEVVRVAVEG